MKFFTSLFTFFLVQLSVQAQLIEDWSLNTNIFPNGARATLHFDSENNILLVRDKSHAGSMNYDHVIQKYNPEGDLLWEIVNDDVFDDVNFNVYDWTVDADDNIILVGDNLTNQINYWQSYAMKVSADGEVLWQHPVTNVMTWSEGLESVAVSDDGSIFAYGMLFDPAVNTLGQSLVKLNPEGEVLSIDYLTDYYLQQLEMNNNRLFSASGRTLNEFNHSCDVLWNEEFDFLENETPYQAVGLTSIQKFHGNNFTIVSSFANEQYEEYLLVRTYTMDGVEVWSTSVDAYDPTPAENEQILPHDFVINENGDIFILGQYSGGGGGKGGSFGDEYGGVFVVALNDAGEVLWKSSIAQDEENLAIFPTAILWSANQVLAVSLTNNYESNKQYVVSFHPQTGSIQWEDSRATAADLVRVRPSYALVSSDDEIYISGMGDFEENNEQLFYLNKYHIAPIVISVEEKNRTSDIQLWPNPANNVIRIVSKENISELSIISIDGKTIKTERGNISNQMSLSINELANGVYTVLIKGEEQVETVRFVKQ